MKTKALFGNVEDDSAVVGLKINVLKTSETCTRSPAPVGLHCRQSHWVPPAEVRASNRSWSGRLANEATRDVLASRLGAGEKRQNGSRFGDVAGPKFRAWLTDRGEKSLRPKMNAANGLRARKSRVVRCGKKAYTRDVVIAIVRTRTPSIVTSDHDYFHETDFACACAGIERYV